MSKPAWTELALKGLARCIAPDRLESARIAIELKLTFAGTIGLRRHPAFADRQIYVFTLFAGKTLRLVVEIDDEKTVWHVGLQSSQSTE